MRSSPSEIVSRRLRTSSGPSNWTIQKVQLNCSSLFEKVFIGLFIRWLAQESQSLRWWRWFRQSRALHQPIAAKNGLDVSPCFVFHILFNHQQQGNKIWREEKERKKYRCCVGFVLSIDWFEQNKIDKRRRVLPRNSKMISTKASKAKRITTVVIRFLSLIELSRGYLTYLIRWRNRWYCMFLCQVHP